MAILTADDIRYKKFKLTHLTKRGYDLDEVDDYLEEVILTVEALSKGPSDGPSAADLQAIQNLNQQVSEYQTKLTVAEEDSSILRKELAELKESNGAEKLEAEKNKLTDDLASKNTELTSKEAELASKETELQTATAKIAELEAELVAKSSTDSSEQANHFEDKLKAETEKISAEYSEKLKAVEDEIEKYKEKLEEADKKISATNDGLNDESDAVEDYKNQLQDARDKLAESYVQISKLQEQVRAVEANTSTGSFEAIKNAGMENSEESSLSMIKLAQELYNKYVAQGKEQSEKMLSEAEANKNKLLKEAKETTDAIYAQFAKESVVLKRNIDDLRRFEKGYRDRMHKFLTGVLHELGAENE